MKIVEEAKSKINISLNLTGKKEDNFHDLVSFICFGNFSDKLILTESDFFDYKIQSTFEKIPHQNDLIIKTIDSIKNYLKLSDLPPFRLILEKNIPIGSGLGGGSADSAALIRLLNKFLKLNLSSNDMINIGSKLGSDIPACIISKPLISFGRGDKIIELNFKNTYDILIIYPSINISTKEIFSLINSRDFKNIDPITIKDWINNNSNLSGDKFFKKFNNDLKKTVIKKHPVIIEILDFLNFKNAFFSGISGSGSACFGIFESKDIVEAKVYFEKKFPHWIIEKTKLNDF